MTHMHVCVTESLAANRRHSSLLCIGVCEDSHQGIGQMLLADCCHAGPDCTTVTV